MSNVRFDELELMLMAMFEQPTLKDTIQVLTEVQPLLAARWLKRSTCGSRVRSGHAAVRESLYWMHCAV